MTMDMSRFDRCGDFHEGYAKVSIDMGIGYYVYNYVDKQGNLLFNEWNFINATDFVNGIAKVETEEGEFFIDKKGNRVTNL